MSDSTTQAVVDDPNAAAKPAVEGADARVEGDELEAALSEFDSANQPKDGAKPTPDTKAGATDDIKALSAKVERLEREQNEGRFQAAIAPVIQSVRGEIPKDVMSDEEILDWMEGKAKRDERLMSAWVNRHKNPQQWGKVQAGLNRELTKKFSSQPDPNLTEDRQAVAAAVRGTSTKAPDGKAPAYGNMSDQEFSQEAAKHGIRI